MPTRDKPPPPIVMRHSSGLRPVSGYDAEEVASYAIGTEFNLVARTSRSEAQQGTYWKSLDVAVKATGRWGSREALHSALKVKLGRVEPIFDLQGKVIGMRPDSTSFAAMPHREFCIFMDEAMAALSEAIGYDALKWMETA